MLIEINRDVAAKVLAVVDAGLVKGKGVPKPGKMCVEAAVCYALGLPHGDDPKCVAPSLRALKIRLNDANWSSKHVRAKGLRRLALAQLGSAGVLDEREFERRLVDYALRISVPRALRSAASICSYSATQQQLRDAADRCETEGSRAAALSGKHIAENAENAENVENSAVYAASAAAYAANAASAAASAAVSAAASAAANAAVEAAHAINVVRAAAEAVNVARDKSLAEYAEAVVQMLVDMKAPGCQWLDLAPLEDAA